MADDLQIQLPPGYQLEDDDVKLPPGYSLEASPADLSTFDDPQNLYLGKDAKGMAIYGRPPGPPAPPKPWGLQTAQQQRESAPVFVNPRTGQRSPMVDPENAQLPWPFSLVDAPLLGGRQIARGVARLSEAEPNARNIAGGAHEIIGGALEAASPLIPAAAARAPIATGLTLAAGTGLTAIGEKIAGAMGFSPEWSAFIGDLAGLAGAGFTYRKMRALANLPKLREANAIEAKLREAVEKWKDPNATEMDRAAARAQANALLDALEKAESGGGGYFLPQLSPRDLLPEWGMPKFPSSLNPVEQQSIDLLRPRVQMKAGTITGNRFLKAAEGVTAATPLGSVRAAEFNRGTEADLHAFGRDLMEEASPGKAQTPESAGAAAKRELNQKIETLTPERNAAYKDAWWGRDKEQFTYEVPIRVVDGKEVMGRVNMPVDLRDIKDIAYPIWDQMRLRMAPAEQNSNEGFHALDYLLHKMADFEPAWRVEDVLGQIKGMARTSNESGVRDISQSIGARLIPTLQENVDAAVAHTGEAAIRGLQKGRAVHASIMDVKEVADALSHEPVQAFAKLTWKADSGIDFLRRVAKEAPDAPQKIGRAYVYQLFDLATREGGITRTRQTLNRWRDLGPETKKLLFPRPELRAKLDAFFKGLDMVVENTNPSGTEITKQATSLNPIRWLAGYAGGHLLFTPRGIALLTESLKTPEGSGRGKLLRKEIRDMLGKQQPNPTEGGGSAAAPISPLQGGTPNTATGSTVSGSAATLPKESISSVQTEIPAGPGESEAVSRSGRTSPGPSSSAAETLIRVPGQRRSYPARYAVRELDDVQASHSGLTFQANPRYTLRNDRDYSQAENQGKVVSWSSPHEFDPVFHITDNPDATNGPIVIDSQGNALGGNGRAMILERVYAQNPRGAQAYRELLARKAAQFGIDPQQITGMKRPVLVREIPDSELLADSGRQTGITDFNVKGTAELRPTEKAIADSRRVSQATLEDMASRLEAKGSDATMAEILSGKGGGEILNRLIEDGVISPQERAAYVDAGELTADGKARISRLMLGRYFRDPAQIDNISPSVRNKIERLAAPLAKLEGKPPEWNLRATLQTSLDLLEESQTRGIHNLDDLVRQSGLFGEQTYSPEAIQLAKRLQGTTALELTKAVRQYAEDAGYASSGEALFGDAPNPDQSFREAFGTAPVHPAKEAFNRRKAGKLWEKLKDEEGSAKLPGGDANSKLETGPHGPIFREFHRQAQAAVDHLLKVKTGEAIGALWHPDVPGQAIDLIYGAPGATRAKGYGLAKIEKWHKEVLDDLQGHLLRMKVDSKLSNENTIQLRNGPYHAVIRRNWKGNPKTWLLTEYRSD